MIFFKKEICIKEINIREYEIVIKDFCIINDYFSEEDLLFINIILLFSLSLKYFLENFSYNINLIALQHKLTIFRKYISTLLQILYKLYIQPLREKNNDMKNKMECSFS